MRATETGKACRAQKRSVSRVQMAAQKSVLGDNNSEHEFRTAVESVPVWLLSY